jgi:MFS family permease
MAVLENTSTIKPAARKSSLFAPLTNLNFRLLWVGQGISLFGDQFYLVALPWLTYQLTSSGMALGTVLMLAGIPRALLMAVGGVWTDRISPRYIMLVSNLLRFGLTAVLTALILIGHVQLWMLFLISFLFGTVDAFFLPAQMSLIPSLVTPEDLQAGNALFQMTAQLSQFVGPALAGLLISMLSGVSHSAQSHSTTGAGVAIGFDTLTFLVAAAALWLMRFIAAPPKKNQQQSSLDSLKEGLVVVVKDPLILGVTLVTCTVSLFFTGVLGVGIPALAATRFTQGAAALGVIISAFGAGSLIGAALSGILRTKKVGLVTLLTIVIIGAGIANLGLVSNLTLASLIALMTGIGVGFTNVILISSLQKRITPELRGRVMSLVLLGSMGAGPLSNAMAGAVVDVNVQVLFIGVGLLLAAFGLIALSIPWVRKMSAELD